MTAGVLISSDRQINPMTWTLRKKILLGYGITLVITLVVLVWAFVNLLVLGRASDAILSENYKSILAAENMINAIERQDSAILLMLLGQEKEGLRQYRENEAQFLQWLGRAKDNITIEGEGKVIAEIDEGYAAYLVKFSTLRTLYHDSPTDAAAFYHKTVFSLFRSVRGFCERLHTINQETMFEASDRARRLAARALWSMGVVGIAALAIGLGFSLLLSNLLVRPLRQIMDATQKIAEGDYDVVISTKSTDELGRLTHEFNTMVKKLRIYHNLNIKQIMEEKRKSEAIIQSIDSGIVVMDADFKVANINPTAARALGIEPQDAREKHFLEVVKSEEMFHYVKQSMESGEPPLIEEGKNYFTVEHNETTHHYQFAISPVHTRGGAMLGVVLILRDVTTLKELDRLKSEFVMTASHELRTPVTSIGMSIGLLMETAREKLNEKERQLLEASDEEVKRLKAFITNLLDLSKIEAGRMEMELDSVPVELLFEKSVAVFKSQAENKAVELKTDIPEELPTVKVDATKITWVLTNLISNALRYTEEGGHIQLLAERIGSQVHILVKDDGAGIPYEYQSKIFDKFVQVKSDKEVGGSGLGLALSKEIVRAHGGTIWVDSTPGEGSTFTFTLPVAV